MPIKKYIEPFILTIIIILISYVIFLEISQENTGLSSQRKECEDAGGEYHEIGLNGSPTCTGASENRMYK